MKISKAGNYTKAGFTLVEIVIIMAILSTGLFFFIPKITYFFTSKKKEEAVIELLDKITQQALKKAISEQKAIVIWGIKGSNYIHLEDKQNILPLEIFDVKVNGNYQEGLQYYFLVYQAGIMDKVEVTFADGKTFFSDPILLKWQQKRI